MGSPFTILQGKDTGKNPIFLVTVVAADGDTAYLTSKTYYGGTGLVYNGNTYQPRLINNEIEAIQSVGVQGYLTVPGLQLTISDADKFIWTNHCRPHGWRGATITVTIILWDMIANQYSTDALFWTFIGSNPSHKYKSGETVIKVTSLINFSRLRMPSAPISTLCIWDFPVHYIDRVAALKNFTSTFYQCAYSADVPGGLGNLIGKGTMGGLSNSPVALTFTFTGTAGSVPSTPFQATCDGEEFNVTSIVGSTWTVERAQWNTVIASHSSGAVVFIPYTDCELIRSSSDPSVGCMARMGDASDTSISIDGNLLRDITGNTTGVFGGNTWLAPTQFTGKAYLTGLKVTGFNQANPSLVGSFYNQVIGTQFVNASILAPANDPNSSRSECVLCIALQAGVYVIKVVVDGVEIPQGGGSSLFSWNYIKKRGGFDDFTGGRNGGINRDNIYNTAGTQGPDPHGSLPFIEVIIPSQLGSISSVQVLMTGPPLLQCLPIATVVGSGSNLMVTYAAGGVAGSPGPGPGVPIIIFGNSWSGANGPATVTATSYGPPGTATLDVTGTGSGTGGGVFYYATPTLYDSGVTLDGNIAGAAANPVWARLDLMSWSNLDLSQIDAMSWYQSSVSCAAFIDYQAVDGSTQQHARFKASFVLEGTRQQVLASVLTALDNSCGMMIGPNPINGLIQCAIKGTLADQQPNPVPGSNYNTPVASLLFDGTVTNGYYGFSFDESNIEEGSFDLVTVPNEETPTTFSARFQDEYNGYQLDSIQDVDPRSYAFSGNQEVQVPVPMLGAPNFDQLARVGNTRLAEYLYGNYRNDPGGTLYFTFRCNVSVIGLASQIGLICGLSWQGLQVGSPTVPQPVRVMSIKPDMDGEHWDLKVMWHNDIWYTTAYAQDPTPFQKNPLTQPPLRPPYPWTPGQSPAHIAGFTPDPLGVDPTFNINLDLTSYPATLSILGVPPVNTQPSTQPPLTPLQASTANTGGHILPGLYTVMVGTTITSGPVSQTITVQVPVGTNTNTITVSGVQYQSGAAANVVVYIGTSILKMFNIGYDGLGGWTGSVPDSNGNPTTLTIVQGPSFGSIGLPDTLASQFSITQQTIIHGGVWGDVVGTVSGGGTTLTFPAASWSTNQFQNRILSLYYRSGVNPQPAISRLITSNTSNTVTFAIGSAFVAGDVVVMRTLATTFSSNTIGDSNFVNSYSPSGLDVTGKEYGNMIQIVFGTGAGTSPKQIINNTSTVYTIGGTFDVTPDATSIFIVLNPQQITNQTNPFSYDGTGATPTGGLFIGSCQIASVKANTIMVSVAVQDSQGKQFPTPYQPFRELYIPAQSQSGGYYPSVPIVSGVATIDPSNGSIQVLFLPNSGALVTLVIGGAPPVAGFGLKLFVKTPATGTYQTLAFTGGPNQFASDIVSGARYSTSPVPGTQDEINFTFHGPGTTVTMANPTIGSAIN